MSSGRCPVLARVLMRRAAMLAAPTRTMARLGLAPATTRSFACSPRCRLLAGFGSSLAESYRVLGASERLYKACARAADYHIPEDERKNDRVVRRDDGEELGYPVDAANIWHKIFGLDASFSTWSHVTMLHLYLLNARVRCFEGDVYRNWQQQLVDHFFFDCEKKMHLDHGIASSALRQRYLKDIFVQWRGLLLAYDEGLIKGDAILASALWRNLFKGSPDVDPRALLAIVGWIRSTLAALEATSDEGFSQRGHEIIEKPVDLFWIWPHPSSSSSSSSSSAPAAASEAVQGLASSDQKLSQSQPEEPQLQKAQSELQTQQPQPQRRRKKAGGAEGPARSTSKRKPAASL